MLSSKLKSWMESHLTRKKSSGSSSSSKKSTSGYHGGGGGGGTTTSNGSYKELSPADRIAHPASSLVNLVPAVPLCSTSGRSNAGLVIRLQNDFREHQHSAAAAAAAAASASSPCHLRQQQQQHHPSWTRSPVMLAWNTKIPPPAPIQLSHKDPPLSSPPSSSSTIIQQVCRSTTNNIPVVVVALHYLISLLSWKKQHFHASLIERVIAPITKGNWIFF